MTVTVALDWTPNTNHLGIFTAVADGAPIETLSPAVDDYAKTPAMRVADSEADLAVAPSESAISYATHPEYRDLVAVAALAQRDTSAIAVLADDEIDRPRDLDGCTYASYGARFEENIVAELIRSDGGEGRFETIEPEMLHVPDVLLDGTADATWVFEPWEGVLAERAGTPLRGFRLDDYGVPYGYTPVLLADPDALREEPATFREALAALDEGHRKVVADPETAADRLAELGDGPHLDDRAFLHESARAVAPAFTRDDGTWGLMDPDRWERFVDWLLAEEVLRSVDGEPLDPDALAVEELFTNEYLP